MAYAQRDYSQMQGINGRYTISSIGCFLTAFSNLLGSYGQDINPFSLNNEFVARSIYIDVDDGIRDDLGWSSISQYDPNINVTASVDRGTHQDAGWPGTNEAIVRFYYRSVNSGQMIFHFCKVHDAANHLIVDSWDGQVKTSPYGEPTGWATYQNTAPVQVAPPPAAPVYQVTETYPDGKQVMLNKQPTNLWGMNYHFDYMKDNPVEVHNQGEIWTVTNKVHHENGYDYYRREGQIDGFNVLDCDNYTPPPPPPPAPPAGAIKIPTSTEPYSVVKTLLGFNTSNDAANHLNAKGAIDPGRYMIFNFRTDKDDPSKTIAINVTKVQGKPGTWINPDDNTPDVPTPPPEAATEPPAPIVHTAPDEPTPVLVNVPNHDLWKTTYKTLRADRKPVLYVSINPKVIKIYDLDQRQSAIDLLPYTELHIVGTFTKDGVMYARAKKVAENGYWYGIPVTILNTYDELYSYAPQKAPRLSDYAHLLGQKIKKLIHDIKL